MKIGFIGAGKMSTAIFGGIINKNVFPAGDVIVSNPHPDKLDSFRQVGALVTTDNCEVVKKSDIVILATKPNILLDVLDEIAPLCHGKCMVSIAAGVKIETIQNKLESAFVTRAMPNTPFQIGMGSTALVYDEHFPKDRFEQICAIFSAGGKVSLVPESQMDLVTAINGSAPALYFYFAQMMVNWAAEMGMEESTALSLCSHTMEGAAKMLYSLDKSPEKLMEEVCSPNGTTVAALDVLYRSDFSDTFVSALQRCMERSKELGR